MDKITVNKSDLLETLRTNREEHRRIFIDAQAVYREKVIEALDRALDDAKNNRDLRTYISLPVPEDHTEDFDTAIQMLEWALGDEIDLDQREFARYVQNQWGWRASFHANTESYSSMLDREE